MSLKDNFNQAIKEILKNDGFVGQNLSDESKKSSSLDSFLGQPSEQTAGSTPEEKTNQADASRYGAESSFSDGEQSEGTYGGYTLKPDTSPYTESQGERNGYPPPRNAAPPPPPAIDPPPIHPVGHEPNGSPYYESEETTIISRNIVISGGTITGFANVKIDGGIKGDVRITKDVSVTGKVVGDIECNNAVMSGSSIQGSVASKGQVRMDRDSVLLGNVDTQYLDMNGRIKGNVDVSGKAEFKTDAVIVGDITASTITVLDGAVIKGYVNTTFLQESQSNIFPEAITVTDQ